MKRNSPGVLGRLARALSPSQAASGQGGWNPPDGVYPRLALLDPLPLADRPGLYALWHLGVRPQWLKVGPSTDLGFAVQTLAADADVMAYSAHDGPFIGWMYCAADQAAGRADFLAARLQPVLQHRTFPCDIARDAARAPIDCRPPAGTNGLLEY